jgi:hypothetical protein
MRHSFSEASIYKVCEMVKCARPARKAAAAMRNQARKRIGEDMGIPAALSGKPAKPPGDHQNKEV